MNNRIAGMLAFFPRLKIFSFQRVFHWQRWELSEDGKFLLIVHDTIQIFRHSSLAKYTIVSLEDRYLHSTSKFCTLLTLEEEILILKGKKNKILRFIVRHSFHDFYSQISALIRINYS